MDKYSWSDRPSEKHRARAIFGAVIIVLTGIVIFLASDNNVMFGIMAAALMFFASTRFYLTTVFYADDTGIGEKFLGYSRTKKWSDFKRVDVGEKAVFLSPFEKPRRLDNYRGWFIPVPTEEIKDFIVKMVRGQWSVNSTEPSHKTTSKKEKNRHCEEHNDEAISSN